MLSVDHRGETFRTRLSGSARKTGFQGSLDSSHLLPNGRRYGIYPVNQRGVSSSPDQGAKQINYLQIVVSLTEADCAHFCALAQRQPQLEPQFLRVLPSFQLHQAPRFHANVAIPTQHLAAILGYSDP